MYFLIKDRQCLWDMTAVVKLIWITNKKTCQKCQFNNKEILKSEDLTSKNSVLWVSNQNKFGVGIPENINKSGYKFFGGGILIVL